MLQHWMLPRAWSSVQWPKDTWFPTICWWDRVIWWVPCLLDKLCTTSSSHGLTSNTEELLPVTATPKPAAKPPPNSPSNQTHTTCPPPVSPILPHVSQVRLSASCQKPQTLNPNPNPPQIPSPQCLTQPLLTFISKYSVTTPDWAQLAHGWFLVPFVYVPLPAVPIIHNPSVSQITQVSDPGLLLTDWHILIWIWLFSSDVLIYRCVYSSTAWDIFQLYTSYTHYSAVPKSHKCYYRCLLYRSAWINQWIFKVSTHSLICSITPAPEREPLINSPNLPTFSLFLSDLIWGTKQALFLCLIAVSLRSCVPTLPGYWRICPNKHPRSVIKMKC